MRLLHQNKPPQQRLNPSPPPLRYKSANYPPSTSSSAHVHTRILPENTCRLGNETVPLSPSSLRLETRSHGRKKAPRSTFTPRDFRRPDAPRKRATSLAAPIRARDAITRHRRGAQGGRREARNAAHARRDSNRNRKCVSGLRNARREASPSSRRAYREIGLSRYGLSRPGIRAGSPPDLSGVRGRFLTAGCEAIF